jgi:CDP-diacylglycerol--serine O-phosphatidyltransferase
MIKLLFSISNLLSYLSLALALLSVYFACQNEINIMAGLWGLSALLDSFDGKFASLFKRSQIAKKLGMELDSLLDFLVFAWTPAFCLSIMAFTTDYTMQLPWFICGLFYLIAGIIRTGYFNILNRRGVEGFTGMPTAATGLIISALLFIPDILPYTWLLLFFAGWLMILPFKLPKPSQNIYLFISWIAAILAVSLGHFTLYFF